MNSRDCPFWTYATGDRKNWFDSLRPEGIEPEGIEVKLCCSIAGHSGLHVPRTGSATVTWRDPAINEREAIVKLAEKLGQSWEFYDEPEIFLDERMECYVIDKKFTQCDGGAKMKHGFGGTRARVYAYLKGLEHGLALARSK